MSVHSGFNTVSPYIVGGTEATGGRKSKQIRPCQHWPIWHWCSFTLGFWRLDDVIRHNTANVSTLKLCQSKFWNWVIPNSVSFAERSRDRHAALVFFSNPRPPRLPTRVPQSPQTLPEPFLQWPNAPAVLTGPPDPSTSPQDPSGSPRLTQDPSGPCSLLHSCSASLRLPQVPWRHAKFPQSSLGPKCSLVPQHLPPQGAPGSLPIQKLYRFSPGGASQVGQQSPSA